MIEQDSWTTIRQFFAPRASAMAKRVREEFVLRNGRLDAWAWLWLADVLAHETRGEIEVANCGYDVSSWGRKTQLPFRVDDFEKVSDFLDEGTGHSVATFESGSGMRAETYEELLYQAAAEQIAEWVSSQGYVEGLSDDDADVAWDCLTDALADFDASEICWLERFGDEAFGRVAQHSRLRVV